MVLIGSNPISILQRLNPNVRRMILYHGKTRFDSKERIEAINFKIPLVIKTVGIVVQAEIIKSSIV